MIRRVEREWIAVCLFPGTTCDVETARAFESLGLSARVVTRLPRRGTTDSRRLHAVVLPGGFAYGDAPAPGVTAAASPLGRSIAAWARRGGAVLGICNGFQILVAAGLFPGRFCLDGIAGPGLRPVEAFRSAWEDFDFRGRRLRLPVAHRWGRFTPTGEVEVLLRTVEGGRIAGVARGRIWGVMPHPERAIEGAQGGRVLFRAFLEEACGG